MGIFDVFRKKKAENDGKKSPGGYRDYSPLSSYGSLGPEHPIFTLLDELIRWDEIENPRKRLMVSRLLVASLPLFQRATKMLAFSLGKPIFTSESEAVTDALNEWADSLDVKFAHSDIYTPTSGLFPFVYMLTRSALEDGAAFWEDNIDEDSGDFLGVRAFDSAAFEYVTDGSVTRLKYTNKHDPRGFLSYLYVNPSTHFYQLSFEHSPSSLWGRQITYGSDVLGPSLIQMMVSRKEAHVRLGNPTGINIISLETNQEGFVLPQAAQAVKDAVEAMGQTIMKTINAARRGRSGEVFTTLPAGVKVDSKLYGEGAQGITTFVEEAQLYLRQLALLTGVPPELLGADDVGGGLGSDKFDKLFELYKFQIESMRGVWAEKVAQMANNYILGSNLPIQFVDQFKVEWEAPEGEDAKLSAEIDKMQAETRKIDLETLNLLSLEVFNGDPAKINQYLEEHGIQLRV